MIKSTSIRFLKPDEISELKKIDRIAPLIEERQKEIEASNTAQKTDKSLLINKDFLILLPEDSLIPLQLIKESEINL